MIVLAHDTELAASDQAVTHRASLRVAAADSVELPPTVLLNRLFAFCLQLEHAPTERSAVRRTGGAVVGTVTLSAGQFSESSALAFGAPEKSCLLPVAVAPGSPLADGLAQLLATDLLRMVRAGGPEGLELLPLGPGPPAPAFQVGPGELFAGMVAAVLSSAELLPRDYLRELFERFVQTSDGGLLLLRGATAGELPLPVAVCGWPGLSCADLLTLCQSAAAAVGPSVLDPHSHHALTILSVEPLSANLAGVADQRDPRWLIATGGQYIAYLRFANARAAATVTSNLLIARRTETGAHQQTPTQEVPAPRGTDNGRGRGAT